MIKLFQKFVEHEAKPRTDAKASAFASALQNREALLLGFGQSQYFPNVGKCCDLSPLGVALQYRLTPSYCRLTPSYCRASLEL